MHQLYFRFKVQFLHSYAPPVLFGLYFCICPGESMFPKWISGQDFFTKLNLFEDGIINDEQIKC